MDIYNLLKELLKLNKISNICDKLLKNSDIFLKLSKLNNCSINEEKFVLKTYFKDNYEKNNLYLMFKIFHINFIKKCKQKSDKILSYNSELKNFQKKGDYIILSTNNDEKLMLFKCFLLIYFIEIKLNKLKNYLGLDFEFNTKKVALMQINFDNNNNKYFEDSFIFLFDPKQFDSKWKQFFAHKIICSDNTYKILHGSESLDTPYIFEDLLENNVNLIKKYTKNFIDTKFLCEYSYFQKNEELGKCKIYYVLKNEEIITHEKLDELHKNEENMGPIYDIIIDIYTMNKYLVIYTLYDVIYLYHLIDKFKKMINNFDLINQITGFCFLEKKKISNFIPLIELGKINNYVVKNKRLNDHFNDFIKFKVSSNKLIKSILKINFFKKTILSLYKFLLYRKLCSNNTVYSKIKTNEIYDNKILDYDNKFIDEYPLINKYILIF